MRFGKTLVVEEADSIEPFMHPLLAGDMQGQGSGSTVRIGDRLVDYNKGFRLMLVSRCPQPKLTVDAAALLTIVNFSITRSGTFPPCTYFASVSLKFLVMIANSCAMDVTHTRVRLDVVAQLHVNRCGSSQDPNSLTNCCSVSVPAGMSMHGYTKLYA